MEYERIVSNDMGIKQVALMDGSTVWLNRNSELVVAKKFMESEFREVTLHGEAFFEVAKNKIAYLHCYFSNLHTLSLSNII